MSQRKDVDVVVSSLEKNSQRTPKTFVGVKVTGDERGLRFKKSSPGSSLSSLELVAKAAETQGAPVNSNYIAKAKVQLNSVINHKNTAEEDLTQKQLRNKRKAQELLAKFEALEAKAPEADVNYEAKLYNWAEAISPSPSLTTTESTKDPKNEEEEEEEEELPSKKAAEKLVGDLSGVEPLILPESGTKSKEEIKNEKITYEMLKQWYDKQTPTTKALLTLESQEVRQAADQLIEEEEEKLVRGTPVLLLPSAPIKGDEAFITSMGLLDDAIVNYLDAASLPSSAKKEVYEVLLNGGVGLADITSLIDVMKTSTNVRNLVIERKKSEEDPLTPPASPAASPMASPASSSVPPTASSPSPIASGSPIPTTTPAALGISSTTGLPAVVKGDPVEVPFSQEQIVKETPFVMEIGNSIKRYHPNSLLCYFGSVKNPDWDNELVENIKAMDITDDEIIWFSDTIVSEYGKKIFVQKRKSGTKEELNELMQLQFCVMRNLNKGARTKTANVKLSDLAKIKEASMASKQGPKFVTPNIPTGSSPEEAALITNEAVGEAVVQNQTPQFVGGAEPVILSVDEARQNFQTVYNNRTEDLDGRPLNIDSSNGELNTTRVIFGGPLQTEGLFSSSNYIPRDLSIRTKRTKRRGV